MTAYQFSQPWLSKLNDTDAEPTAREFAKLRTYLKGLDDGSVSLFNLVLQNLTLQAPLTVPNGGTGLATLTSGAYVKGAGTAVPTFQAAPIPVADGGTNSTTALANGKAIVSSTSKIVEGSIGVSSAKWTGLDAGTANGDSIRYEQLNLNAAGYIKGTVVQYVTAYSTANDTTSSNSFQSTSLTASITPKATTHVIRASVSGSLRNTAGGSCFVTLFRGSTDVETLYGNTGKGFVDEGSGTLSITTQVGFSVIDTPATTSSTTYTVKFRSNALATVNWNENTLSSYLLLEEIVV